MLATNYESINISLEDVGGKEYLYIVGGSVSTTTLTDQCGGFSKE